MAQGRVISRSYSLGQGSQSSTPQGRRLSRKVSGGWGASGLGFAWPECTGGRRRRSRPCSGQRSSNPPAAAIGVFQAGQALAPHGELVPLLDQEALLTGPQAASGLCVPLLGSCQVPAWTSAQRGLPGPPAPPPTLPWLFQCRQPSQLAGAALGPSRLCGSLSGTFLVPHHVYNCPSSQRGSGRVGRSREGPLCPDSGHRALSQSHQPVLCKAVGWGPGTCLEFSGEGKGFGGAATRLRVVSASRSLVLGIPLGRGHLDEPQWVEQRGVGRGLRGGGLRAVKGAGLPGLLPGVGG